MYVGDEEEVNNKRTREIVAIKTKPIVLNHRLSSEQRAIFLNRSSSRVRSFVRARSDHFRAIVWYCFFSVFLRLLFTLTQQNDEQFWSRARAISFSKPQRFELHPS